MDAAPSSECLCSSSASTTIFNRPIRKPLKGCLKSPTPSPLNSPGSSDGETFVLFAQACADLQTLEFSASESAPSSPVTDGSLTPRTRARKNVSFCSEKDGLEQVFTADEWDRTPTEPAGQLSYQDMLELKAIQRTLPRAQQLPDLFTGKPAHQYLKTVPIGLLPLTDQSTPTSSPSTPHPTPVSTPEGSPDTSANHSPPCSPVPTWHSYTPSTRSPLAASALAALFASKHAEKPVFPHNPIPSNLGPKFVPPANPHHTAPVDNSSKNSVPPSPDASSASPLTPTAPPSDPFSLAHLLPSKTTTPMRRKPNFAFLPLLDTPPSSGGNTPTPTVSIPQLVKDDVSNSPSSVLGSPINESQNACDDEPPSEAYASDSERGSGSGYTDGSPLSRSTSITSVSTVGSMHEASTLGSAYCEERDLGFFFMPPSKHVPLNASRDRFGDGIPFVAKDPCLQAVSSPVLAPPSPFSLDPGFGEIDLAKAMQERLQRVELERSAMDLLEDAPLITRSSSLSSSRSSSTPVSAIISREPSRERTDDTDLQEIERARRRRLGSKWTPPSSQEASRVSSRAPSRERNVVEINGVEIELDD